MGTAVRVVISKCKLIHSIITVGGNLYSSCEMNLMKWTWTIGLKLGLMKMLMDSHKNRQTENRILISRYAKSRHNKNGGHEEM